MIMIVDLVNIVACLKLESTLFIINVSRCAPKLKIYLLFSLISFTRFSMATYAKVFLLLELANVCGVCASERSMLVAHILAL